MKRVDLIASLIIGEVAALLMLAISRNITLPAAVLPFIGWLPVVFPFFTLFVMVVGSVMGRYLTVIYQLAKFSLVGGMNFLVDLGALNLLIALTGIAVGFYATAFKAVGFLVALVSSFFWNKFWTFQVSSVENARKQFAEFFAVTVVGLLINVGVFAFVNNYIGARAGINPPTWASLSATVAAAVGLMWNFIGYKFVVFKKESRI